MTLSIKLIPDTNKCPYIPKDSRSMKQRLQRLYSCLQWGYTLLLQFYALQTVAPSVLAYDDDAPVLQYLAGEVSWRLSFRI